MHGHISDPENESLQDPVPSCSPKVVGTIADLVANPIAQKHSKEAAPTSGLEHENPSPSTSPQESSNFFKSLQWSTDGTSILTSSANHNVCSFILPPDLLDPPHPHIMKPYATHPLPEPVYATTLYPSYDLTDPSTCLLLASPRNLPMRLYSTLGGGILGSYPLVSPTTEVYIAPHSLLWPSARPDEVLAGLDSMIAIFDTSRPGEGPVTVMRTGRKRRARSGTLARASEPGDGLKGIVSAMDVSCNGVLAAGSFGRSVGLYDGYGHGETNAIFSTSDGNGNDLGTDGNGITQVIWDNSGRYLCVAERGSDGLSIWDIRGTGKRLAWLKGRKAKTPQRMGVALINEEVWAGGTDGTVRVWQGLGMKEGAVERDWEFEAHGDVVSGVGLHPGGSVLATCSGQRHYLSTAKWEADGQESSDSDSSACHVSQSSKSSANAESQESQAAQAAQAAQAGLLDNSLKVWAL